MKIPVTEPFLPPKEEYDNLISQVWERNWLTNNGPLVQQLEKELKKYLKAKDIKYVSNGTIALQIAIKALELKGEIITTPFSYIATTSSIVWEGCSPVFVDIDPDTLNIDPDLIETSITDKTSAILATHVFGNPCNIEAIQKIADRHNLKVIYDAAHCFGTKYKGKSVYSYGDISTASFHATKLFHTIEGGALIAQNPEVIERIRLMRNFGHDGPGIFSGVGINGKNSEFHAAMGLCNLDYIDDILAKRKQQCNLYRNLLNDTSVKMQKIQASTDYNHSYQPIIFENKAEALRVKKSLESKDIFPRRYFYPSLNTIDYTTDFETPWSEDISKRILCLPLYHNITENQQRIISEIIIKAK